MEQIDNPIEIDVSKYTEDSLELIFSETNKLYKDISDSLLRVTTRSILGFTFYCSLLSFSFFKILEENFNYIILALGSGVSIFYLIKNLLPYAMAYVGTEPKKLLDEYYSTLPAEEQKKELLSSIIESYDIGITRNLEILKKRISRFNVSAIIILVTLVLFGGTALFRFIQCYCH